MFWNVTNIVSYITLAEPDHISEDEDGEGLNLPGLEQNAGTLP